jgi:hypothetical protein
MLIELDDVKMQFVDWLYLKDHEVIDILLGAVVSNQFRGPDAINLNIVGPPSSTKTELLRSLSGYPSIYTISTLTPQTLLSGIKGSNGSLLLNLRKDGKNVLVIKDLTSILEMRSESRQEIFGQLREIADGYLSKTFGTGKRIEWVGKLGLITGVTGVIDEHHGHNEILGARCLYCRVSNDNPKAMAERARRMAGKEIKMRYQLKEITKQFLEQFNEPKIENVRISEEIEGKLISLACFVALARTGVSRDHFHQIVTSVPEAEGPARLTKQLWILGAGIAAVQGKEEFDEGVYKVIKRVAMNSLPKHRNVILKVMWETSVMSSVWEHTRSISKMVNMPTNTTVRCLEDLWMLTLLSRHIEGEDDDDDGWKTKRVPYGWQLSKECIELIESSQIYLFNEEELSNNCDFNDR